MRKGTAALLGLLLVATTRSGLAQERWVGTWENSPAPMPEVGDVSGKTFRSVAHISLGGTALRVAVTNQSGSTPLRIGAVTAALADGPGKIRQASGHPLTFNGKTSVTVPAGTLLLSDPVEWKVDDFSDLALSVYVEKQTVALPTCHLFGISRTYVTEGDHTADVAMSTAKNQVSTCFLEGVIVRSRWNDAAAVVAYGDSITDGTRSTYDANRRYPDALARRLHADRKTAHLAVINAGIGGNRVLYEGRGPSALARFDTDVLSQPGVRWVIYMEGINDIGQHIKPGSPEIDVTADELILAAQQLVTRAHLHGIKVMGGTLTPWGPRVLLDKPGMTEMRPLIDKYNDWVRTSGVFDAVVDFYKATGDPDDPKVLRKDFDSGDHTHPSDAGYQAMADAIDLRELTK